jgi:putative nucleotidyltransferase with HDIG domain
MNIKNISTINCNDGDILAYDVYSVNGNALLVAKETILNGFLKEHLYNLGIKNVSIYKQENSITKKSGSCTDFSETYINTITYTKRIFHDIMEGNPPDATLLLAFAKRIYKNSGDNYNVIKCIADIRTADEYTYIHSVNVSFYSMLIAKWLGLSGHEITKAILAGLLHDVGKIKIPGQILNKAGKLTKPEFDIIKNHTVMGYEIVDSMDDFDSDIKSAVLLHHERMDGSGYPLGCYPEKLNLYSRIVAIADVYDAMTSERVYKSRSTPFEAFRMFQSAGLGLFDVKILNVFMNGLANYLMGIKVLLSNGEVGEIVFVPLHSITNPIIQVSDDYLDLSRENSIKIVKTV